MESVRLALLGCLYLTRSGRAPIRLIAEGLGINTSKLTPVFRVLTEGKILKKGKAGFELEGNPLVADLFEAFYPLALIAPLTKQWHSMGGHECRAALTLANSFETALAPLLKKSIRMVGNDQLLTELNHMSKLEKGATN